MPVYGDGGEDHTLSLNHSVPSNAAAADLLRATGGQFGKEAGLSSTGLESNKLVPTSFIVNTHYKGKNSLILDLTDGQTKFM